MIITAVETWIVKRGKCLFDKKRQGDAAMDWDVVVVKLHTDEGISSSVCAMAARSAEVTAAYIEKVIAPVVLGRSVYDREAIWQQLWVIDRHEAFFPVFLPGPIDVALWELASLKANLPLYQYIGAFRKQLPVYASSLFHQSAEDYINEAKFYINRGIRAYKAHPPGPWEFDMEVHKKLREALGDEITLMSDPVGDYTLEEAIRVGRGLEDLNYLWFEEPFRDFELMKYQELCRTLDIPIAATETTRGCHWGVAQSIALNAADIVRADVSWKCGITGTLKIAHLAEAFGKKCEVHTTTMNCMDLANLHVSCAIRNCDYFEYFVPEDEFRFPMKGALPIDEHGMITVPDCPGIGAELDWVLIDNACVRHQLITK